MTASPKLARDMYEVVRLPAHKAVFAGAMIALIHRSGALRYPVKASGALERMTVWDKLYWLFKTRHPIERAVRGSGLESFFAAQASKELRLPDGFTPMRRMTLSAAGDLMNHPYLARSSDTLFRSIQDLLFDADLATANLECVVRAGPPEAFETDLRVAPPLAFEPDVFDVIVGSSIGQFGLLATACNHSLDYGAEGIESTIAALQARNIQFAGVNASEEDACRATIVERDGFRIGAVSFTFGLNAHGAPRQRPRIVNVARLNLRPSEADLSQLEEQLAHAERENVDFVVAHLHWGMEHEYYPRPAQLELAHHLAERGVDLIVGHHAHVLQPFEYYRTRRDRDRVVPIFYSLGNLTTPCWADHLRRSGIARLVLAKGKSRDGETRTYVESAELVKVEQVVEPNGRTLSLRRALD